MTQDTRTVIHGALQSALRALPNRSLTGATSQAVARNIQDTSAAYRFARRISTALPPE